MGAGNRAGVAVRVYDISKMPGVEPKLVIAEAKEMGIVAARSAFNELDEEAAKRLEAELRKLYPDMPAKKAELN